VVKAVYGTRIAPMWVANFWTGAKKPKFATTGGLRNLGWVNPTSQLPTDETEWM
jgi:hypothetical protein